MSENRNRFAQYDTMATEALEELLRLDAQEPESDTDKILYIMEVLAERKKSHTGNTAQQAYESFKQNYMPEAQQPAPTQTKGRFPCWLRGLTAAAAVLVILLVGSATAKAFGFNLWKTVIQWTQETFHFGDQGNPEPDNSLEFDSLQAALEEGNTPSWLAPTYIPEGYQLTDIIFERTPVKKIYKAKYINGEKLISITVQDYLDNDPVFVEQSENLVEEYKASGIVYYIISDVAQMKAKWITGPYDCSISGNVTVEELKMMIDSIEKG